MKFTIEIEQPLFFIGYLRGSADRQDTSMPFGSLLVREFNSVSDQIGSQFNEQIETRRSVRVGEITEIKGFTLKLTCPSDPEQYNVFDPDGKPAAYLRLRCGYFSCQVPDVEGTTVFEAFPIGDGIFEDDERMEYLTKAIDAVIEDRS